MLRSTAAATVVFGLAVGSTALASTDPVETEATPDFTATFSPEKGLSLASADGGVEVKLGGRIQYDLGWMSADDALESNSKEWTFYDGSEFRRARLGASGKAYDAVDFKFEIDFANGKGAFKDAWMGTKLGSWGMLKVGHFKEPFGLEQLTSGNHITFNERALSDAFTPARNSGIMLSGAPLEQRLTWAVGAFRESDDWGDDKTGHDGEYSFTGRLTYAPILSKEGDNVLHFGIAESYRAAGYYEPDDADGYDAARFKSSPENHLAPTLVDTGNIASEGYYVSGLEAAWAQGPISVQGEYNLAKVDCVGSDDATLSGYYVMASYFLTGENRPYKAGSAVFGRPKPKENFGQGGVGAWEVALRYSQIDLNDQPAVEGGELSGITAQLNWYLNPNTRVMLGYVHSELDKSPYTDNHKGKLDSLLLRFAIDF